MKLRTIFPDSRTFQSIMTKRSLYFRIARATTQNLGFVEKRIRKHLCRDVIERIFLKKLYKWVKLDQLPWNYDIKMKYFSLNHDDFNYLVGLLLITFSNEPSACYYTPLYIAYTNLLTLVLKSGLITTQTFTSQRRDPLMTFEK